MLAISRDVATELHRSIEPFFLEHEVFHGVCNFCSRPRGLRRGEGVDHQSFWDQSGRPRLCPLLRGGQSWGSTLSGLFEEGFYADQVAFLGRPLVPTELSNTVVICLELKLKEVRGHYGPYLVEGWPSNDYIVGRGYVDYQKVNLKAFKLGFAAKAYREANRPRGIDLLFPEP